MAYKAVLIDDNKNTVISLQYSINWEELGVDLAGAAYDGKSGKELIEKENPDIIISDINMPYMDGLSMVEESAKAEDRIVIVITGYDKFQYASRAIKMAVFDYILKPIDDDELNDTLKRAVRKLNKRHSMENRKSNTVKAMITVAIVNHRDDTIDNIIGAEEILPRVSMVMIGSLKGEPTKALLERIETLTLLSSGEAYSVVADGRIILLVVIDRRQDSWQSQLDKIREKFTALEELSSIGASACGTGQDSFYSLYLSAYEDLLKKNKKVKQAQVSDLQEKAIELADNLNGSEDYEKILEGFLVCTAGSSISTQIMAVIFCTRIMSEHKSWRAELNSLSYEVAGIPSQEMFMSWLKTFLLKVDEIREKNNGKSELVLSATRYIKNHCLENLRLESVAEKLSVSPNYLSTIMKKETGITFQQHIIAEKMNIARKLLDDTRMTIDEISTAVGYENYISFYNAFRKNSHMTPSEYRVRKGQK